MSAVPERPAFAAERIDVPDSVRDINDLFYARGWTDGLPIIPPTEEAVAEMLRFTDRAPSDAIGDLPPQVQDTIRRQTDNVQIKEIGTREVANQSVYSVRGETNGAPVELMVSRAGTGIEADGSAETDRAEHVPEK